MKHRTNIAAAVGLSALASAALALANVTGDLLPNSDGTYAQWFSNLGATHYIQVDDATCNGTTNFVYTNSAGARDSYGVSLASVPDGSTITAIEVAPCASRNKNGKGTASLDVFYRWNGTDSADAGAYELSGTTPTPMGGTTFSGLSLAKDGASSLEIGTVFSSGNRGARVSRLAARVTYTPPPPQVPAAPSHLTAQYQLSTSTDVVHLQWSDNSTNEVGFQVERGVDGFNFSHIATTSANRWFYSDFNVSSGNTYYYRVRAFNGDGASSYSNVASATVP